MENIQFNDIDFSSLQKPKQQGTKSTLYIDENICYKILDGLYDEEKSDLYKKLLDMDGIKIEGVLLPKQLIVKEDKLFGYTMDYFKDSVPLSDKFIGRYIDFKLILDYLLKASRILRNIHDEKIICQDLSFENIIVTKDGNIAFCDLDGCCYKDYISPFISMLMKRFWVDYRQERMPLSTNLDRVSMMISFYYWIYIKEIQDLSRREYTKLSKKIKTIDNARIYANSLVDKSTSISYIPYLDELIDISDDYVFDREEQFSLVRRLFKR